MPGLVSNPGQDAQAEPASQGAEGQQQLDPIDAAHVSWNEHVAGSC